ncbi:MAG: FUSC family protein [Verrucomicrobiota bacterium]
MIARHFTPHLKRLFERSVLTVDVARALRSSLAFTTSWVVCLLIGQPTAAAFAATTAQNVALTDVRGDYRVRLAVLLTKITVLAGATLAGVLAAGNPLAATFMMAVFALLGGVWRHLSADYGPNLAVASALLFLIGLSQPTDMLGAGLLVGLVFLGGLGAILLQAAAWWFRPQHPLRHAVAENWVAASDLISALRTETNEGEACDNKFTETEQALRATLDSTFAALTAAQTKRQAGFVAHLTSLTDLAGRLGTRVNAFYTALEPLRRREEFRTITPALDLVLRSLANTARSTALAIITHRADQFIALEIRLRRNADLIRILDTRLAALPGGEAEVARQLLGEVTDVLPVIKAALEETVDLGAARSVFHLQLPELSAMSLRSLSSWLNSTPQLNPVLLRYTIRVTVLSALAVAVYEIFKVPRGYWIAFTIMVVLQPDYGATRKRAGERILGTIAGTVLGSALIWVRLPLSVHIALAAITSFLFAYFLKRRYGWAVFFVTLMLVLITDAVTHVSLEFTVGRLLSNLAGGVVALIAALFFWPSWEQEQFPKLIAAAVRANRDYLLAIATHLKTGEPYVGKVVAAKRVVERANSVTAASLQRMLAEPPAQQHQPERAAALTTANQRVTRALTVLGVQLNKRQALSRPELEALIQADARHLDELAQHLEEDRPVELQQPNSPASKPTDSSDPAARLFYLQLAKVETEIEALTMAALPPA